MKSVLAFILIITYLSLFAQIKVDTNFENSNVKILHTTYNKIFFTFNLYPRQTFASWFYFKFYNFEKFSRVYLYLIYDEIISAPHTIVYSYDGINWHKIPKSISYNRQVTFIINTLNADTIYVAANYPYTYSNLVQFLSNISSSPYVQISTLTVSENGNQVFLLKITDTNDNKNKDLVWIIARQHAFEAPSNFVLEGMINFLISENELAQQLRKETVFYIVPMMDVDNVIRGAAGRGQEPVDFNRDWTNNPYWNAVKATINKITQTASKYNFRIFIDLHAPFPNSFSSLYYFNLYPKNSEHSKYLYEFINYFTEISQIELNEIVDVSTSEHYADVFIKEHYPYIDFSTTIECGWNYLSYPNLLTPDIWRKIGYFLAEAIAIYLNPLQNNILNSK